MTGFAEVALIITIAAVIAALMRLLKQPIIIGYILTGLILGPYAFNVINSRESLDIFGQFGIAILLFMVGLSLSPVVIREIGKVALISGIAQVIFTSTVGFLISKVFGFGSVESIFIAIALTFSSTIIILKLLSDKGDLDRLYGKIATGFLLVQDIIAAIFLIAISSPIISADFSQAILTFVSKALFLAVFMFFASKFILPKLAKFFAQSQEFLFLFSIAWGTGIAALSQYTGFTLEIGALIAGVALSWLPYNREISSKMRPLRDFFLIIFFIYLGSNLLLADITRLLGMGIVYSLFVLLINPLIMMIILGIMRYPRKIGFYAGLTVAQISEFSLILLRVGEDRGYVSKDTFALITIVGILTIAMSSYLIIYADKIYPKISKYLKIFERKRMQSVKSIVSNCDAVLFGYNRIGYDFVNVFTELNYNFIVVDFDPNVIQSLNEQRIPNTYGDAGDDDFIDELNLSGLKIAVSTIPDHETNLFLINKLKKASNGGSKIFFMLVSHDINNAMDLYKNGAGYVIMPHFLGGKYASELIKKHKNDLSELEAEKDKHLDSLVMRIKLGQKHPPVPR